MKPIRTPLFARSALAAAVTLGGLAFAGTAAAATKMPEVQFGVEKCVPAVLAKHPGEVLQVVLKPEDGKPVWEIEIAARDGKLWDVECSGATGKIVEVEQRFATADAPEFKAKVKVAEATARATALAKHPGTVTMVEFEIEEDGRAVYEYDIRLADGSHIRVEVDAGTGKLHEASPALLVIGRIPQ